MLELLATSFPVIIRYFQLKRRGEAISVWNMKTAVFCWLVMAFFLFLLIFYFHPKTYSGLVPFRTISVVAQTTGPVTDLNVQNGQRVKAGDLLFRIEDSAQKATLGQAQAQFDQIAAAETKAKESIKLSEATVKEAESSLRQLQTDLDNAQTLLDKKVGTADSVRKLQSSVEIAEAELAAAQVQLDLSQTELTETIPAQKKVAEAAVEAAAVALEQTEVRAFSEGTVTQLAMSVGSPASKLILSPAMVIIPERDSSLPTRITAGFAQVSRDVLYEGMPAEIACDSNANLSFRNAILPAKIAIIQPAIAAGQVVPSGNLREPNKGLVRGSVLVYLELVHKEHEADLLDGSGCIIQTYTNNLEGISGHLIAATGVVKAVGLRLKVWGSLLAGIGLAGGSGH